MSQWAFSRFFKKNTGKSFTDCIATPRLGLACKLLAETAMPVTGICFEIGYATVINFSRASLAYRGMQPSAYHRLARQRLAQRRGPALDTFSHEEHSVG